MHKVLLTMVAGLGAAVIMSGTALASDEGAAKTDTNSAPKVHIVQLGDSLSSIAEEEKLDSWRPLWNVNPDLSDPNMIYADQKLVVPEGVTTDRPVPEAVVAPAEPVRQSYATPVHSSAQVARPAANYAAGAPGILQRVRMRESGGNYATNTGNGYYGAYQFDLGTWKGVGGSGLPSNASPAEQDMRAQMLYSRRGCSPWPNTCF